MKYKITLGGRVYEVEVEETRALLLNEYEAVAEQLSPQPIPAAAGAAQPVSAPAPTGDAVTAPMSGTVVQVAVTQGQAVKKGALLLVLEAMKMENEILAPRDGVVAQLPAAKGAAVEAGAALVVLA